MSIQGPNNLDTFLDLIQISNSNFTNFTLDRRRREKNACFYDFGSWGYYTSDYTNSARPLPGFTSEIPDLRELCGEYNIIFAAALRYNSNTENADMQLRRLVKGSLLLHERSNCVDVGIGARGERKFVSERSIISGNVRLKDHWSKNFGYHTVDRYFGPGYNFWGFTADSMAHKSYPFKASNSATIVTHRNDNKGRLYVVSERKAFRRIDNEQGPMNDSELFESQEHETREAERACRYHHLSFLCTHFNFPREIARSIKGYLKEPLPFIFAEPGDIWIDIRLSTPVRTYILARKKKRAKEKMQDCKKYHPGVCEATPYMKRRGKYLDPQLYDNVEHKWHLAKDKNWGPWSCCGRPANAIGCAAREHCSAKDIVAKEEQSVKKYVKFIEGGNIVGVAREEERCYRLDNDRIAKKKTEGTAWVWYNHNRG